jgi:hypothetical protein
MSSFGRVVAVTLFAAAALAVPAQATAPQAQTIKMAGHLTGPNTIAGTWAGAGFVDGTGAYERLKGGGTPATVPGSFGDICTGAIEITHAGKAHDD